MQERLRPTTFGTLLFVNLITRVSYVLQSTNETKYESAKIFPLMESDGVPFLRMS